MKNDYPKKGDIYWIDLDPAIGTETQKKRPCVILSNNIHNRKMTRIIAAPITSQVKNLFPFETLVLVKGKQGKVMLDQLRCFDKQRLQSKYWELDSLVMQEIEDKLKILFDLIN